jgi:hypothetical protein
MSRNAEARVHGRQNLKPFLWQIFLFKTQTNYKLIFHKRKGSDNSDFHIVGIITFFFFNQSQEIW